MLPRPDMVIPSYTGRVSVLTQRISWGTNMDPGIDL